MSTLPDSIEALSAEVRHWAEKASTNGRAAIDTKDTAEFLFDLSARLDALAENQPQPCHGQAVRYALERLYGFWKEHGAAFAVKVSPIRETGEAVEAARDVVMELAEKALAEPARNCDRHGTAGEAEEAFNRLCKGRGMYCGPHCWYYEESGDCRFAWAWDTEPHDWSNRPTKAHNGRDGAEASQHPRQGEEGHRGQTEGQSEGEKP